MSYLSQDPIHFPHFAISKRIFALFYSQVPPFSLPSSPCPYVVFPGSPQIFPNLSYLLLTRPCPRTSRYVFTFYRRAVSRLTLATMDRHTLLSSTSLNWSRCCRVYDVGGRRSAWWMPACGREHLPGAAQTAVNTHPDISPRFKTSRRLHFFPGDDA